jgi:hypothetical protein
VEAKSEIMLSRRGKQAVIALVAIRSVGPNRQQDLDEAGVVAESLHLSDRVIRIDG